MRVALYARVSTEDQAKEGFSLDAQMKRLEAYCRSKGWEPVFRFVDDGYSGRDIKRPAYTDMMQKIEEWDTLLVLKMDRIHRNSVNFAMMMDLLKKNGKEFSSVYEKFDTNVAMGRFVMDIMQRIAQLESEQIGERVKMGMKRKAEHGSGVLGSGHPYGYEYSSGSLIIHDNESQIVRKIFSMSSEGHSTEEIAKELNDKNIPAKKGGIWNRQSIHKILRNPLYTGRLRWGTVERDNIHPAIIDASLFDKVNEKNIPSDGRTEDGYV
ncbi:MAG: recombinase family protein [Methanomassiliicoccaceae archaeon]|nr:recombinase family protein [Methanomassiliicoccaceae archaeon]